LFTFYTAKSNVLKLYGNLLRRKGMNLSINFSKLLCVCMVFIMQQSFALPNEYQTFKRTQSINYEPNEEELVRIWMIYVGQGDSILIQIPESLTGLSEPYDVLNVPYHGSRHNDKAFFEKISPVLGVASMGKTGFETNRKHLSEYVVKYLGGSNRLHTTYAHEKRFKYKKLDKSFAKMRELKHILIESDGDWFRVVEIPVSSSLDDIPTVPVVKTGNVTQWISAKEKL